MLQLKITNLFCAKGPLLPISRTHDNDKEQLWWREFQTNGAKSFEYLYYSYADLLFGYGMKMISDEDIVTETIQSLFVYIYEKRNKLAVPESVLSYMLTSFKRMLMKEAGKRYRFSEFDEGVDTEHENFNLELDVETAMINSEVDKKRLDLLQNSLLKLSNQQREIIYLKYYKELKNEDIANILGISNQIVRNVASRALKKLKELVDDTK